MKPANVCRYFRTKKLYVPEQADEVFAQEKGQYTHEGHCWCNRTLAVTGPDDKLADIQSCSPTRSCFEE